VLDPLTKDYPWYTPYQFAGNMPILAVDLDGMEPALPWQPGGWLWWLWMKFKSDDPTGVESIISGSQQQADVKDGNSNYHNNNVPDVVQKRLDDINTKEGTAKVVKGGGQLVEWQTEQSLEVTSMMVPVEEGIVLLVKMYRPTGWAKKLAFDSSQ
jgi:hypothetical protein